jgi:GYF domain 2
MQMWISLILNLILAWTCGNYAKRLGRNPTIWLIAGALFGILAFLTLAFLASRKPLRKATPAAPAAPTLVAISPSHTEKFWYYLSDNKEQFGPMSFQGLGRAWKEGIVGETTFVWNEEMENWQHFKDVVSLQQK